MTAPDIPIPTRQAALSRLFSFAPQMGADYTQKRNLDPGPDGERHVSVLSPYVRHHILSERELVKTALDTHGAESTEKFIQEVCWRSYFKGWLEHRPGVWSDYRNSVEQGYSHLGKDGALRRRYEDAISGEAGVEGFDSWARELVQTGYLHNHARMSFASIWMFTLKLPWALGADFFLQNLMDGDPASNTLSWRWVGGLHTPGKTYLANRKAIETCSMGRFSPDGLSDDDRPVQGPANPDPGTLPEADAWPEGPVGLFLCEDDLQPETIAPSGAEIAGIAGCVFPEARSPNGAGECAKAFTQGALEDALARAGEVFSAPSQRLEAETFAEAGVDWAKAAGVTDVVTAYAPVGWARPKVRALGRALSAEGITLHQVRRDWDNAFWPHATKGYFKLKKRIPETLDLLGF